MFSMFIAGFAAAFMVNCIMEGRAGFVVLFAGLCAFNLYLALCPQ